MWILNSKLTNLMEEYEDMTRAPNSSKSNEDMLKKNSEADSSTLKVKGKETTKTINNNSQSNDQVSSQKQWTCRDFQMGKQVGKGSFGVLYMAKEKRTNEIIVAKILFKSDSEPQKLKTQVIREIEIHARLNHPNILRMYGYCEDDTRLFLVLELAYGDLLKGMQAEPNKRFSEAKAVFYVIQLIEAVKYIHKKNVIHRDLKPENLLVDKNNALKLTDFGWAVHRITPRFFTPRGTLRYMAPEMHLNEKHDKPVDLWAIGATIFELLTGNCPFGSISPVEKLVENILNLNFTFPIFVTAAARHLISQLIVREPEKRLTPEQILDHDESEKHFIMNYEWKIYVYICIF